MLVTYQSLVDGGHLDIPGVPEPVAVNAIRKAAIEFCDRSLLWVADHDPIDMVAGESACRLSPPNGTAVVRIEDIWLNEVPLIPTTRLDLQHKNANWNSLAGTPSHYMQENTEEIIIFPTPTSSDAEALTLKVALKPSRRSTTIENWIVEKYLEELMHGASWKLMEMPGKSWTDIQAAMYHKSVFDAAIVSAQLLVSKGMGKAPLRTRPVFF